MFSNLLKTKVAKWFFHKYFDIPKDKDIFKVEGSSVHYWENKEKGIAKVQFGGTTVSGLPVVRNSLRILLFLLALKFPSAFLPLIFGTTETFTSSTTWTCPSGVTSVDAECWGGGGDGGGYSGTYGGGGGGGGAYSKKTSISVTPSSEYTVTVGGAPGDSWFIDTSTVLAKGGVTGTDGGAGGAGGAAASGVGDTKYSGGAGAARQTTNGGGGGSSAGTGANGANASGSTGGTAPAGGGDGGNGGEYPSPDPQAGSAPGGGGGGGARYDSGASGAGGKVILTYETADLQANVSDSISLTDSPTLAVSGPTREIEKSNANLDDWKQGVKITTPGG